MSPVGSSGGDPQPTGDRSRVVIRRIALVVWAFVVLGCLLVGSTSVGGVSPTLVALLAVASAAWAVALLLPEARLGSRTAGLVGFGILGAALDTVQPRGPGFVAGFMAVAGLGLLLPIRRAALAGLPVFVALAYAESRDSTTPWAAVLNIGLGLAFMMAAAAFAATSRDAHERSRLLLAQQQSITEGLEREAVLTERTKLARELHDVLAHTLSGLSLHLEAARLLAARTGTDPQVREQIEVASRYARNGAAEGKRAIAALRGEPTAGVDDVEDLVTQFRNDAGIPTRLERSGLARPIGPHASLAVYRVVQESLSNVRKHAPRSSAVEVGLRWEDGRVLVTVTNRAASDVRLPAGSAHSSADMPGSAGWANTASYGLAGLAERVAALGGTFEAAPTEHGFAVSACIPTDSHPEVADER